MPSIEPAAWLAAAIVLLLCLLWAAVGGCQRRGRPEPWSSLAVLASFAAIYAASSRAAGLDPLGQSPFPHYVHLAESFLHGRLDLPEPLFEVATHRGRMYVMEPILPGILMAPLVAIWGLRCSDIAFLILIGALNAALVWRLWDAARLRPEIGPLSPSRRLWLTVLFALGTPHWYLSVAGRVWHTEGITALCCLLIALHEVLGRGRSVLVHAWLGFAFLCHPPAVFSLPCFWLLLADRLRPAGISRGQLARAFGAGLAVLGMVILAGWCWYNYARFGNMFETGLTEVYESDVRRRLSPAFGMMSVRHIARHLPLAVWAAPLPVSWKFPFLNFSLSGFSLFWATPPLLYLVFALRRRLLPLACWAGSLPVLACLLCYHSSGASQFGYRRVLDALPWLLILAALGMARVRWRGARALVLLSVLINGLGLLWFYRVS